jgi:hypothetical protein
MAKEKEDNYDGLDIEEEDYKEIAESNNICLTR